MINAKRFPDQHVYTGREFSIFSRKGLSATPPHSLDIKVEYLIDPEKEFHTGI